MVQDEFLSSDWLLFINNRWVGILHSQRAVCQSALSPVTLYRQKYLPFRAAISLFFVSQCTI